MIILRRKFNNFEKDIIKTEFEYIAQCAFQANEDRIRIPNYFIVTFFSIAAALISPHLEGVDTENIYTIFIFLFSILGLIGVLTLLQISKLRIAWIECANAMNKIKNELISKNPNIQSYISWRIAPSPIKLFSISVIQATLVSLICGLAFSSIYVIYHLKNQTSPFPWFQTAIILIMINVILILVFYYFPLRDFESRNQDEEEEIA